MLSPKRFSNCLAVIALIASSNSALATFYQYTVTDLGSLVSDPNSSTNYSYAFDINDQGDVVGFSKGADNLDHAFIRLQGQSMTDLGHGRATSINNHREFVGWGSGDNYLLWKPQGTGYSTTDLGIPSIHASSSYFLGQTIKINEEGSLAGSYTDANSSNSHFFWKNGVLTDLMAWDGCYPDSVVGLNNQGDVARGNSGNVSIYHSATNSETPLSLLGISYLVAASDAGEMVGMMLGPHGVHYSASAGVHSLSSTKTNLWDINNSGWAVGGGLYADFLAGIPSSMSKAIIALPLQDSFAYLNDLVPNSGWNFKIATAINDAGQIVGVGINPQGRYHAFLLTPHQNPLN